MLLGKRIKGVRNETKVKPFCTLQLRVLGLRQGIRLLCAGGSLPQYPNIARLRQFGKGLKK